MNTSELFKKAILNLYRKGIYTADYAIILTEALRSRNRLTEEDYMELLVYLAAEQAKEEVLPEVAEEPVEEVVEVVEEGEGEAE